MAFRKVTPQIAAESAMYATQHAGGLRSSHAENVADLLKLATAPADANTVLTAVHKWRAGQKQHRLFWRTAALLQVMSGDRDDAVCAGLGFGRTALQEAARREPTLADFVKFLYRSRPKQPPEGGQLMARFRRPTPSNVTASRDIQTTILERIAALSGTVTEELEAAAAADPQDRLAHLVAARHAEQAIDAAVVELAAAAIVGGMSAAEVARRSSISTATLTRRMSPYLRALRGEHVVPDPDAPYGWRPTATVSRDLDQGFCIASEPCALNRSRSRSGSRSTGQ